MNIRKSICLAVSIAILAVPSLAYAGKGCKNLTGEPGYFEKTIWSGGVEREYILYVHPRYKCSRPTPLVFLLHGRTQSPEHVLWATEMESFADAFKFILAVPKGIDFDWEVDSGSYDVTLVSDMIDAISADYCIHPDRVFATGYSKGGGMSIRLACDLADRIAAIGPVAAGNNWLMRGQPCEPSRLVPILQFNGTEDVMIPWEVPGTPRPPVPELFGAWADLYGCTGERVVVHEKGDVTCYEYEGCPDDTTLRHCIVEGGGHNWPGAVDLCEYYEGEPFWCWLVGHTTEDMDASRELWKFFAEHGMANDDCDD